MSAAAVRPMEFLSPPPAHVSADHVHNITPDAAALQRELRQRDTTIATLIRELRRTISAPTIVGDRVVDGMLTVTYSTGAVQQRRLVIIDTATESGYAHRWVALEPVPETGAAIVADALADIDETDDGAFDPTFRVLASLALLGGAR